MPLYQNQNQHSVHLTGPDGKIITLKSRQIVNLPDYFESYRQRGFISALSDNNKKAPEIPRQVVKPTQLQSQLQRNIKKPLVTSRIIRSQIAQPRPNKIVGSNHRISEALVKDNNRMWYPISNNIGVGVLSYNRVESLRRCLNSIEKNTDLNTTTVFISDDNSTDPAVIKYLDDLEINQSNFVIIRNNVRLGVAGNSNRLLRALSRFNYGFLLNDDIEILKPFWENYYIEGLQRTGYHHFVFRQEGIYNAKIGTKHSVDGVDLYKVTEKPHGACLAFTNKYLKTVGAFNEAYGEYGMEHVDWSEKGSAYGLQPDGFYDIAGSEDYLKLHNDASAIKHKNDSLNKAKALYETERYKKCEFTDSSLIPSVSVVIAFREQDRNESLVSVVNNIRAQKFPNIEIILVEEDVDSKVEIDRLSPITYARVPLDTPHEFNKSKAYNLGVQIATSQYIVMHDADMLAINHYLYDVYNVLQTNESCHIGATVLYANIDSTNQINNTRRVFEPVMERVVSYYEGGSIACRKDIYWKVGGHNEDFYGYGCEDCDFYARLMLGSRMHNHRKHNFLHLYHGRSKSFHECHMTNKEIYRKLETLSINERIARQVAQMKEAGYIKCES